MFRPQIGVGALFLALVFASPSLAGAPWSIPVPLPKTGVEIPQALGVFDYDSEDEGASDEGIEDHENRVVTSDFTYRYSRDRTQRNLQKLIAKSPNAQARAELERMLSAQPYVINDIRSAIAPYGLDTHNVADAYAFWMINAWLVANKRDENPDRGTIAMVQGQVRNAFANAPNFANTDDADRQEYAEALLLQSTLLASAYEQWRDKPEMLDQIAKAAKDGAMFAGLDLSLMTLTDNGFAPRSKAHASAVAN